MLKQFIVYAIVSIGFVNTIHYVYVLLYIFILLFIWSLIYLYTHFVYLVEIQHAENILRM